jgi:tRNA(Phe) wybutosine-synthesizing methylase Tyw3
MHALNRHTHYTTIASTRGRGPMVVPTTTERVLAGTTAGERGQGRGGRVAIVAHRPDSHVRSAAAAVHLLKLYGIILH